MVKDSEEKIVTLNVILFIGWLNGYGLEFEVKSGCLLVNGLGVIESGLSKL